MVKRSKSSKRWLEEHFVDEFVMRAKKEGYRSRAVYKLIELQERYKLIKPGMRVVDLGAAPGGWSQVLARWVGKQGQVIALDRLDFPALAGVESLIGDFTEDEVYQALLVKLGGHKLDVVLSDMAPNLSGIAVSDQARMMGLAELVLEFARQHLNQGGFIVVKLFQGAGFDELVKEVRKSFQKVAFKKPKASRSRSREVYLLAEGFYR